jgi:magnesium transporter
MAIIRPETHLQESLETIMRLLERHRVLETLAQRHEGPRRELIEDLQRRQNLAELQRHLRGMHPADIAHILEALPLEERRTTWAQLEGDNAAAVFLEVSDAVRSFLLQETPSDRAVDIVSRLHPEDLAYLSADLPPELLAEASTVLEATERSIFDESVQYSPMSVGHLMTREWVEIRETQTLGDALAELRSRGELPRQMDHMYVVDGRNILRGVVPVQTLLVRSPETAVTAAMRDDVPVFRALDDVHESPKRSSATIWFPRPSWTIAARWSDESPSRPSWTCCAKKPICGRFGAPAFRGTKTFLLPRGRARAIAGPGSGSIS